MHVVESPCHPVDNIRAVYVMIVRRIRGKIIVLLCAVLCMTVVHSYVNTHTHIHTHTHTHTHTREQFGSAFFPPLVPEENL